MVKYSIDLTGESDGSVCVTVRYDDQQLEHRATQEAVEAVRQEVAALTQSFVADRQLLEQIGKELRDVFLKPIYDGLLNAMTPNQGRLLVTSDQTECLRLPWELLPALDGDFLGTSCRWTIVRSAQKTLRPPSAELRPPPLRIVFASCAPTDLAPFDYEQEEEAVIRIGHQLSGNVHIEIAEPGTFEEVSKLVAELQPQIVHLSGHSILKGRMGHFAFEDERGASDLRPSPVIADAILSGNGVRILIITGDQSSKSGAATLCDIFTATSQVPIAVAWTKRMADESGGAFVRRLLSELIHGHGVETSVSAARQELSENPDLRRDASRHDLSFAWQQVYAGEDEVHLVDRSGQHEAPLRPVVRHELLGDNICGLAEGFVGRRRLLQRTGPALRNGEKLILVLAGISGSGRSTLAANLASVFRQGGFQVVAVQARRYAVSLFPLRLLGKLATACKRLGCEAEKRVLGDSQRPVADRLRVAVDILSRFKILLVLDNLEELLPLPPAPPVWENPEIAGFFDRLASQLKGEGRVIITCSELPESFDLNQGSVACERLPAVTAVDFFKYMRRFDEVTGRIARGELSCDQVAAFHRKLGITPRFNKQACSVMTRIKPAKFKELLDKVAEGLSAEEQQAHFCDLFLSELYNALPPEFKLGLSRLALVEVPLPPDGVSRVSGLNMAQTEKAVHDWFTSGLVLEFRGEGATPLFTVHPLQQEFFTHPDRLPSEQAKAGHLAAAGFLQDCFELNIEEELHLSVTTGLVACLKHAAAAGDHQLHGWAVIRLSRRLQGAAGVRVAHELMEPLVNQTCEQSKASP